MQKIASRQIGKPADHQADTYLIRELVLHDSRQAAKQLFNLITADQITQTDIDGRLTS
jgi:hypothetical protein